MTLGKRPDISLAMNGMCVAIAGKTEENSARPVGMTQSGNPWRFESSARKS